MPRTAAIEIPRRAHESGETSVRYFDSDPRLLFYSLIMACCAELRGGQSRAAWRVLATATIGCVALVGSDARGDDLAELRARVEVLERLVAKLQGQDQQRDGASAAPTGPTQVAAIPNQGFTIAAADGISTVRVRGLLHFDGRYFADDITSAAADAWVLRRARPSLQARLSDFAEVGFTPEFAGGRTTILDAFVTLHAGPSVRISAGKFKVPIGLERIMSAADLRFIERGLPTSLVPNRDLGVQLHGDVADGALDYSLGYFNGVNDGASSESNVPASDAENDASGDWAARLFIQPFLHHQDSALHGLGFGLAATYVRSSGSTTTSLLPAFRTPGQQTFFEYRDGSFANGSRVRLAPQFYYYYGPLGALGEVVEVAQDVSRADASGTLRSQDLRNSAWQLQFAWLITGEQQKFRGAVAPIAPFSLDANTWGALEFVARYHELDTDADAFVGGSASLADPAASASRASAFGIGINWYLNQYYKWSLNYDRTHFDGGAANGRDRGQEQFLSGRFSVSF